jgi:hypothetical protein
MSDLLSFAWLVILGYLAASRPKPGVSILEMIDFDLAALHASPTALAGGMTTVWTLFVIHFKPFGDESRESNNGISSLPEA